MDPPTHEATIGSLLDYEALAEFIANQWIGVAVPDYFVDAPCGNGRLVELLSLSLPPSMIIGVEIDQARSAAARARCDGRVSIYCGDIFRINDLVEFGNDLSCVHVGSSFFNSLPGQQRLELLRVLAGLGARVSVGFEIRNPLYFQSAFEDGKWYATRTVGGAQLRSRSFARSANSRLLELEFNVGGRRTIVSELLYDWMPERAVSDCRAAGLFDVTVSIADYRSSGEESHYFIVASTAEDAEWM